MKKSLLAFFIHMYKHLCLLPLSLCITAGAWAQTVTGRLDLISIGILTWESDNLAYADGSPYSANTQSLVCMDRLTRSYGDGGTFTFEADPGTSVFLGATNPGEAGIAAVHWLFDNYYEQYSNINDYQGQRPFQYALWELADDYDGTIASIDPDNGNVTANDDPESNLYGPDFDIALEAIHEALRTALVNLPDSYRSSKYDISFLKTTNPAFQSLVSFNVRDTPEPPEPQEPPEPPATSTPVPALGEWSVISLTLGLGLFGLIRLRRKQQS